MEYKTSDIYFGSAVYNGENEGYYFCAPEAFCREQKGDIVVYRRLDKNLTAELEEYKKDTPLYLTVTNLTPITKVMDSKNPPEYISDKKIKLYLFKHRMEKMFEKQTIDPDYKRRNTK